jgi:hypothetical protein
VAWTDWLGAIGGGLGAARLGLGAISDILGALSAAQAASQQRQLFKQQYRWAQEQADLMRRLRDPTYVMGTAQAFYQPLTDVERNAMTQAVMSNMALRGIADSAFADKLVAQALGEAQGQRWLTAIQQAMRQLGMGVGGLPGVQQVPQPIGGVGALGQALQSLQSMAMLERLMGPATRAPAMPGLADTSWMAGQGVLQTPWISATTDLPTYFPT